MPFDQAKPQPPHPRRSPEPPPLRVVRKGWFTVRESTETLEQVERANEERRKREQQG